MVARVLPVTGCAQGCRFESCTRRLILLSVVVRGSTGWSTFSSSDRGIGGVPSLGCPGRVRDVCG